MKVQLKYLLYTMLFYAVFIAAAFVVHGIYPGGPCVPGLGFMMLMALLPISIIGLIITVILYFSWRKNHSWAIWCHFAIMAIFLILIAWAKNNPPQF